MSGNLSTLSTEIAANPSTASITADILASMSALSGVLTDYNPGSQIRTFAESIGSVEEVLGFTTQSMAFQSMIYAAYSAFGITPLPPQAAQGTVIFSTGPGANPPASTQNIFIPAGTVVQTNNGIQFQTLQSCQISVGNTSVSVAVGAVNAGSSGNVAASTIISIASGLPYTLFVQNTLPTTSGSDAEAPAETLARFTATVASLGEASPVSIANACIGISVSGTTETVKYSTVYEPWIAQLQANQATQAGFDVYIDNGSGTASSNLILAVKEILDGNPLTGQSGYRPAGVPYNIYAVTPTNCSVVVSGTASTASVIFSLTTSIENNILSYFNSLQFGVAAEYDQIVAQTINAAFGLLSSLSVTLLDGNGNPVQSVTPALTSRIVQTGINIAIKNGSLSS